MHKNGTINPNPVERLVSKPSEKKRSPVGK